MSAEIREETAADLAAYDRVPIAFTVRSVFDVEARDNGLGGFSLTERTLDTPYVKDYDRLDGGPARWPDQFDLHTWGFFGAYLDGHRVGGGAVVYDAPGVDVLEGRADLAVLWDIRVAPGARGRGVGAALFRAAAAWAAARGCTRLKVETQNVNVAACRFYVRQGCMLGAVHRFAYSDLPEEMQLLWYRPLP